MRPLGHAIEGGMWPVHTICRKDPRLSSEVRSMERHFTTPREGRRLPVHMPTPVLVQDTLKRMSIQKALCVPDLCHLNCPRVTHLKVLLAPEPPQPPSKELLPPQPLAMGMQLHTLLGVLRGNTTLTTLTLKGAAGVGAYASSWVRLCQGEHVPACACVSRGSLLVPLCVRGGCMLACTCMHTEAYGFTARTAAVALSAGLFGCRRLLCPRFSHRILLPKAPGRASGLALRALHSLRKGKEYQERWLQGLNVASSCSPSASTMSPPCSTRLLFGALPYHTKS